MVQMELLRRTGTLDLIVTGLRCSIDHGRWSSKVIPHTDAERNTAR